MKRSFLLSDIHPYAILLHFSAMFFCECYPLPRLFSPKQFPTNCLITENKYTAEKNDVLSILNDVIPPSSPFCYESVLSIVLDFLSADEAVFVTTKFTTENSASLFEGPTTPSTE